MSALTSLILVLFLLLIAAAAVAWLTLTAGERAARAHEARETQRTQAPPRRPRADASNDRVRGAKAPRTHASADAGLLVPPGEPGARLRTRRAGHEDAFERFLDPERRRDGGDR